MNTRTFYDRISPVYDLLADDSERACRDKGLGALTASPGERILEIGVGTGHALAAMALAVGSTGYVCGVDVSAGMLKIGRRTVAGRAGMAIDDARSLCFRNAVFDAVFMSFTLELFDSIDISTVLAEVERVLRPRGRLAVVAMAEAVHSSTMTDVYQWLHEHFPHLVDCRPINVFEVLVHAGFRMTCQQTMSIWGLAVVYVVALRRETQVWSTRLPAP